MARASANTLCSDLALGQQVLLSPVREACGFGNISTEAVSCSEDDGCNRTLIFALRLLFGYRG